MTEDDAFEELPEREPAWAVLDKITAYRKRLLAAGYQPLPVNGKAVLILKWSEIVPTDAIITNWAQALPDHTNTGLLTRTTPTIDIDCLDPFAAETIENLAREQFGDRGRVLVRFGRKPKRAIPLRTDAPFSKIVVNFKAPNGSTNKIEVLGNGQQTVINGIHPDTKQPYEWFGGEPGEVCWQDLPLVNEQDLRQFVADAMELLTREDYEVISGAPKA